MYRTRDLLNVGCPYCLQALVVVQCCLVRSLVQITLGGRGHAVDGWLDL